MVSQTSVSLVRCQQGDEYHRVHRPIGYTFNPNTIQLIWLVEKFPFKTLWITRFGGMDPLGCNGKRSLAQPGNRPAGDRDQKASRQSQCGVYVDRGFPGSLFQIG